MWTNPTPGYYDCSTDMNCCFQSCHPKTHSADEWRYKDVWDSHRAASPSSALDTRRNPHACPPFLRPPSPHCLDSLPVGQCDFSALSNDTFKRAQFQLRSSSFTSDTSVTDCSTDESLAGSTECTPSICAVTRTLQSQMSSQEFTPLTASPSVAIELLEEQSCSQSVSSDDSEADEPKRFTPIKSEHAHTMSSSSTSSSTFASSTTTTSPSGPSAVKDTESRVAAKKLYDARRQHSFLASLDALRQSVLGTEQLEVLNVYKANQAAKAEQRKKRKNAETKKQTCDDSKAASCSTLQLMRYAAATIRKMSALKKDMEAQLEDDRADSAAEDEESSLVKRQRIIQQIPSGEEYSAPASEAERQYLSAASATVDSMAQHTLDCVQASQLLQSRVPVNLQSWSDIFSNYCVVALDGRVVAYNPENRSFSAVRHVMNGQYSFGVNSELHSVFREPILMQLNCLAKAFMAKKPTVDFPDCAADPSAWTAVRRAATTACEWQQLTTQRLWDIFTRGFEASGSALGSHGAVDRWSASMQSSETKHPLAQYFLGGTSLHSYLSGLSTLSSMTAAEYESMYASLLADAAAYSPLPAASKTDMSQGASKAVKLTAHSDSVPIPQLFFHHLMSPSHEYTAAIFQLLSGQQSAVRMPKRRLLSPTQRQLFVETLGTLIRDPNSGAPLALLMLPQTYSYGEELKLVMNEGSR